MSGLEVIAAATLVAGGAQAVGAVQNYRAQSDANKESRKASRLEQRRAAIENARQRRRAIAAANIQSAQTQSMQASMGDSSSTGQVGTLSAIQSQTAGNIGFQRGQEGFQSQIIGRQSSANRLRNRGAMQQALWGLPAQLGAPGLGDLGRMFGGNFMGPSQ